MKKIIVLILNKLRKKKKTYKKKKNIGNMTKKIDQKRKKDNNLIVNVGRIKQIQNKREYIRLIKGHIEQILKWGKNKTEIT